ncbi:hypothetical protein Hanom_Chr12g01137211 [Helianthus anomalus]
MIPIIISIPFINSPIPPRSMNFSINSITLSLAMRFQHFFLNFRRSCSQAYSKNFLYTPTPSLGKKKGSTEERKERDGGFCCSREARMIRPANEVGQLFVFGQKLFLVGRAFDKKSETYSLI